MTTSVQEIRPAVAGDWPAVAGLLVAHDLPLAGVEEHLSGFFVAVDEAGSLLGVAGVERYGAAHLLRSVAVRTRQAGVGGALVAAVLERSRREGAERIILLTTTAAGYFPRFGFQPIARSAVPTELQQSIEFREACPAEATVMQLLLPVPPA